MTNNEISKIPLFDPFLLKMYCHLFGVTTVLHDHNLCIIKVVEPLRFVKKSYGLCVLHFVYFVISDENGVKLCIMVKDSLVIR